MSDTRDNMVKMPAMEIEDLKDMPGKPMVTMNIEITEKVRIFTVLHPNLIRVITEMREGGRYDQFQTIRNDIIKALTETMEDTFTNNITGVA